MPPSPKRVRHAQEHRSSPGERAHVGDRMRRVVDGVQRHRPGVYAKEAPYVAAAELLRAGHESA
jgi:hypothetical protein